MTLRELIEALQRQGCDPQRLEWEVLAWAEVVTVHDDDTHHEKCLVPVVGVDCDKYHPADSSPSVVELRLDDEYDTSVRVSDWLNGERSDWREAG